MRTLTVSVQPDIGATINARGSMLKVMETENPVVLNTDGARLTMQAGDRVRFDNPRTTWFFEGTTGQHQDITVVIGDGEFTSDSGGGSGSSSLPSEMLAEADRAVAGGNPSVLIADADADRRECIIGLPADAAHPIRVSGQDAAWPGWDATNGPAGGLILYPGQSVTLDTTSEIRAAIHGGANAYSGTVNAWVVLLRG